MLQVRIQKVERINSFAHENASSKNMQIGSFEENHYKPLLFFPLQLFQYGSNECMFSYQKYIWVLTSI